MEQSFFNQLKSKYSRYKSKKEIEEICFNALINSYERVKMVNKIENLNENRIRDEFVVDLELRNDLIRHAIDNYIIIIVPESYNAVKRKRSDIEFILPGNERKIVFECKKLFSAERRYLNDGLIRFIRLEYAEKEKDAGMIGFVIKPKDLSKIISEIKRKVSKFHFHALVDKPVCNYPYSFQSVHIRQNYSEILIFHFFFEF